MSKLSKASKARRGCLGFLIFVSLCGMAVVLFVAATIQSVLNHFRKDLPDVSTLSYYEPAQTTKIFSNDGELIATLYKENRTWTRLEDVSPHLVHAVLAIEDSRFHEHHGVDPIGVLRAAMADYAGDDAQGASTITMQLARNLFLTPTRSIERKLKEVLLAIDIEQTYTKDEILELYLNQIYFGAGAYGVQAASGVYFGKRAKDLTAVEASLIAGLPQAPSKYSPLVNEQAARERQVLVLGRMVELGYLTWPEYRAAVARAQTMKFKNQDREEFQILKVPYFTTYVIKQLYKQYDEDLLYRGGLKIYTTVDLKLQKKAEAIVREQVQIHQPILNLSNAALVCIENKSGFVRVMVGGTRWSHKNQFNRAWQARRQPGSSFKTFVYATALECGYTPSTVVPDSPITYTLGPGMSWSPKNSDGSFMGAIPLATALQHSRNVVAVRLLNLVGAKRIIETAHAMGLESELQPVMSLALGAADVSPLEMARAISCFPNQGIRIPATPIKVIYDREGNIVQDNRIPVQTEVLAESTASSMMEMMRLAVQAGTGYNAQIQNHEVGGKTGTTDDFRDAWFVGYTRDYTTTVWVGNDDFSKMWTSFGGDCPATIWRLFMTEAMKGVKPSKLPTTNPAKVGVLMCSKTGRRVGPECPQTVRKYFLRGAIPTSFCPEHGAPAHAPGSYATSSDGKGGQKPVVEKAVAPLPKPDELGEPPVPTRVVLPDVPAEVPMTLPGGTHPAGAPEQGGAPTEVPVPEPVDIPAPDPVVLPVEVPVVAPPADPPPAPTE
ncbi:MAG: penicillin-binding protein 1A [Armatimonadetes bacterium]|nr:penicillin-binding protein 1A [Armatimonadota bacterium]